MADISNTMLPSLVGTGEAAAQAKVRTERYAAIDMLRGAAMVFMALDHWAAFTRVNITAEGYGGVRPALSSPVYVLTGLITNLASGIFFTLTGASIAFFERSRRKRGWTEWEITRFLLIRAAILLVLDQVINRVGWGVTDLPLFEILSALAFALIALAFVRQLPLRVIAGLAAALFVGYPLLVSLFPHNPDQPLSVITTILLQHHRDAAPWVETPWLGRICLVLAGYVFARLLNDGKLTISTRWLWVALAGFAMWLVLRLGLLQGYGDFLPFEPGSPWVDLFIDSKHPPSLTFLLFNMSWSIVLLVVLEVLSTRLKDTFVGWTLTTLGQTALFFFVAHMLFYKALEVLMGGQSPIPDAWIGNREIIRLYLECALTLVILLPLCARYRNLRHEYSILSYL